MGFFKFFKKSEEMSLKQARGFFNQFKASELERITEGKRKLKHSFTIAKNELQRTIDNLNNAKLLNEKIPPRERAIMEGNRRAYTSQASYFINSLPEDVFEAAEVFTERINSFLKGTMKSYQVLTQFFETEVGQVASKFKRLESVVLAVNRLHARLKMLDRIQGIFDSIEDEAKTQRQHREMLHHKRNEIKKLEQGIERIEEEITNLKQSEGYLGLSKLRQKRKALLEEQRGLSRQLYQALAQFSKLYRKYQNLKGDRLSSRMMQEPFETFQKEPRAVFKLISELSDLILRNQLKVKPTEKGKLLRRLNELDNQALLKKLGALKALKSEITHLDEKINNSNVISKLDVLEQETRELLRKKGIMLNQLKGLTNPHHESGPVKEELQTLLSKVSGKQIKLL